jgi:hypothetical protein
MQVTYCMTCFDPLYVYFLGRVIATHWAHDECVYMYMCMCTRPKEVDQEDDQETDSGIVYKQILRSVKLQLERKVKKNRVDWERTIKEAKVRIGL